MRLHIAIVGILAVLMTSGCSYLWGSSKKTAEKPSENFIVVDEQREQWRQLAEKGDAEAEYQLGMSYCCGFGPGHTDTTAYKWLCRAALQGHEEAQYQLGRMFGNGIKKRPFSTPQQADYAYLWYGLAAAQGSQLAAGYLAALEEFMTPDQIARARDWEKHPADVAACG